MEPDVVEIAPPVASCSRTRTPKTVVPSEVIDVDQYEVQYGSVHNNNNVDNKGKAVQVGSFSYNLQFMESADGSSTVNNIESDPGTSPVSHSLLDPDSLIYEDEYDSLEQLSFAAEEADNYSIYQDLFDSKDIPTGVEVAMDWFPSSNGNPSGSKSSLAKNGSKPDVTSSSKKPVKASENFSLDPYTELANSIPKLWNAAMHSPQGTIPIPSSLGLPQTLQTLHYSAPPVILGPGPSMSWPPLQPQTPDIVMGVDSSGLMFPAPPKKASLKASGNSRPKVEEVISAQDSSRVKRNMEDYLGTYLFFKRFDIVEDFSDHYYASRGSTSKQHPKEWVRKIQEEWRLLENDLPDLIFVRAYESRMDLLRAVIIGAEGTPYHDGLFFFDIHFPDTYPSAPPTVHYHAGGLRINPNLYNCGKVCLSLLGTWSGSQREKWIPNDSTMLQVLVSIQGLILNQKPYFNEPGYEKSAGSALGESSSKAYSENTFMLSLKTMVYNMRRPPKHFEDFSYGHFFSCAHNILKACNAYKNGAPVGSLVNGDVQVVEESDNQSSSKKLRTDVANFMDTVLIKEFILLGVIGLEEEKEEDKAAASETNASSNKRSNSRSRSKRDRVSS